MYLGKSRETLYDKFYENMSKVFFIYKMEHHNLWDKYENDIFKITFAQNLYYTQNELKSLYLKWAHFKYAKWKFASEIGHFVILPN